MRSKLAAAAAAMAVAATVATAAPAAAERPYVDHWVGGVVPVEPEICGFPVELVESAKGVIRYWEGSDRLLATGPYKVRIVNVSDPADRSHYVDVNATGPVNLVSATDGEGWVGGHTLILGRQDVEAQEWVGIRLVTGRWTIARNDAGGIESLTGAGQVGPDLCPLIAS